MRKGTPVPTSWMGKAFVPATEELPLRKYRWATACPNRSALHHVEHRLAESASASNSLVNISIEAKSDRVTLGTVEESATVPPQTRFCSRSLMATPTKSELFSGDLPGNTVG